jgi:antitoxin HigA-1
MRLARYFGGDAQSWPKLQTAYDLRIAEISNTGKLTSEITPANNSPLPRMTDPWL